MKKKIRTIVIVLVVVLLIVLGFVFFAGKKGGQLKVNTIVVHQDSIEKTVTATGYVQPVDQVEVGTQVSGVIQKIFVDFNSQVKKGDLLAELDKSTLNERLIQANASLASAQSGLTYAQQNYDRTKQLYGVKAATQAAYDDVINQLSQAKTTYENAKASLRQAKVDLSYAEIYSPIDGVVLNRAVEEGQTVAASFSTPTLFTIANDLKNMQVEADVDEADIGQVKDGQRVQFTVDSFQDDVFEGTVKQIRLQPTVTSNVVTYTVIIEAPNPEEKLYPGMTASVTIITNAEKGLTVPAAALNFEPTSDMIKKLHIMPPKEKQTTKQKGVWVQSEGRIEYREVTIGTTDAVHTIIEKGLNEGDSIVVSVTTIKEDIDNNQGAASNPFMPKPPGRGKR